MAGDGSRAVVTAMRTHANVPQVIVWSLKALDHIAKQCKEKKEATVAFVQAGVVQVTLQVLSANAEVQHIQLAGVVVLFRSIMIDTTSQVSQRVRHGEEGKEGALNWVFVFVFVFVFDSGSAPSVNYAHMLSTTSCCMQDAFVSLGGETIVRAAMKVFPHTDVARQGQEFLNVREHLLFQCARFCFSVRDPSILR